MVGSIPIGSGFYFVMITSYTYVTAVSDLPNTGKNLQENYINPGPMPCTDRKVKQAEIPNKRSDET
jgi:hypothetical protein